MKGRQRNGLDGRDEPLGQLTGTGIGFRELTGDRDGVIDGRPLLRQICDQTQPMGVVSG